MTSNQKSSFLLKSYGYLWLWYIGFGILLGLLSNWFPDLINTEYKQTAIIEMAKSNPLQLFVLACVFAPIVEEMMFRTLINPSHSDLILFICSWFVFLSAPYLPATIHWLIKFGFSMVVLFVLHTMLKQLIPEELTSGIRKTLSQFVTPILIISAILFGLVHISNYVTDFTVNTSLLILVIPQIIAGFMLGWVKRTNTDITWSMGLHFMNNVVPVAIIIFGSSLTNSIASHLHFF